jgi:hypothetical protein
VGAHSFSQMGTVLKSRTRAVKTMGAIIVRIVASKGLQSITSNTPVDTSRLVSNWQASIGSPRLSEVPPKSSRGGGKGSARSAALSAGLPTIMSYQGGSAVFIANGVPYAGVIEHGDSKHRPVGMFAKGLQAMRNRAKSISITSVMAGKDPT